MGNTNLTEGTLCHVGDIVKDVVSELTPSPDQYGALLSDARRTIEHLLAHAPRRSRSSRPGSRACTCDACNAARALLERLSLVLGGQLQLFDQEVPRS